MAKKKISDSNFVVGDNPPRGAAKPRMGGKNSKAPAANASNSASPANPGGKNLLNMIKKDGTFKTGHSK